MGMQSEFRDYRLVINLFSEAASKEVRTPEYRAFKVQQLAYRTEVLRGENDRVAAETRRAVRAQDTKTRIMMIAGFGTTVGAGYAGWGALIGSCLGPGGTLVGAVIGGAVGSTVGAVFGALKS
ncbi:MAG: hypothetical protein LBF26_01330 [Puniceicoccales bacterium]|nr:hypothetical protein [Puniceicoccales bacterium]